MSLPHFPVAKETYVFDVAKQRPIMVLDGAVTLPVGTEIELPVMSSGQGFICKVVKVRVCLAGPVPDIAATIWLDCEVPPGHREDDD